MVSGASIWAKITDTKTNTYSIVLHFQLSQPVRTMQMLDWEKLLCESRRKENESTGTKGPRTELERDYDRILFASPTRRLADKTQVFPLDPSDSVRTRLTHSLEVSNLARSVGMRLAFDHAQEVFGDQHEALQVKRKIPALLAAIGLAHDLGNPPFGHQGEGAMRGWFEKRARSGAEVPPDFLNFDGNPQTFRLLTRLQILNDDYGLNLTYATLAALVKYPSFESSQDNGGYGKFGVFESEKEIIEEVWGATGLAEGARHPLAHVLEACDDIAYAVLDAEDTVKKGYASFYDLMDHLDANTDEISKRVTLNSKRKNAEFKKEDISASELNEISMQMFRVFAIYELVQCVTNRFVDDIEKIMSRDIEPGFELVKSSEAFCFCKSLKTFDRRHGFANKRVLELELLGQNYIDSAMNMLWEAIDGGDKPFSKYAMAMISENYRRARERSSMGDKYKDYQLLCDFIAGMTDGYLTRVHDKLKPLRDGFC